MRINPAWLEGAEFFKVGRGCSHCNGTGFEGRKPPYEALMVDEEIAHELHGQPTPSIASASERTTEAAGIDIIKDCGFDRPTD